jgi:hypothetical protein
MASEEFARAVRDFDEIAALYPELERVKAHRRKRQMSHPAVRVPGHIPGVDRDGVMLALVTKAITTHRAIRVLAEQRLASDATALQRVLLENVILIEWILRDVGYRIDLYAESDELLIKHLSEVTAAHYTHRPELVADAAARAARHAAALGVIFGDTQKKWARRLAPDGRSLGANVSIDQMFDEVAQPEGKPAAKSFMKEVVYFTASWFVHTNAPALRKIAGPIAKQRMFALEVHRDDESDCARALLGANLMALSAVSALNQYAKLDLDAAIERVQKVLENRVT